ncbi:MAG TPA: thioredoxin family protein [Chryseosolibacter sp.]|nr:thioredoxin family protein [Chryseosolibacter sp.]
MKFLKSIALMFFVGTMMSATTADNYGLGDTVADFKLKNVDGKSLSLSDFKDAKGIILIFDCNTCPFSKAYNERIIALDKTFSGKGFPVVAINSNDPVVSPGDSYDEMVKHAKSKGYTFPYLFDETQSVAKAFGATNTPHVFVLNRDGDKFNVAYIGAIDNNARDEAGADKKYVEDAVNALLEGKDVSTTKTKAIGCTIKWKNA